MGFATIVEGGEDGRYTIELDTGEPVRLILVAQATAAVAKLEAELVDANALLDEAEAAEAEQALKAQAAINAFAAYQASLPPGSPMSDSSAAMFEVQQLNRLKITNQPLRTLVDALKFDLASARKKLGEWNLLQTLETRQAWCADFTEDREAGAIVGTIEIPGEPKLVLIKPGAAYWNTPDGFLLSRELMRPDHAFFNAAVLPGVTKWKPKYRWGTITAMDDATETCTVEVAEQTATQRRLDVNQETTLTEVPVEYMDCGYSIFEVDDRVVVEFLGQDWAAPRIIGFVDNPRACNFPLIALFVQEYFFGSILPDVHAAIIAGSAVVEAKLNGGAWQSMSVVGTPTATARSLVVKFDTGSGFEDEPRGDMAFVCASGFVSVPDPFVSLRVSPSYPLPPSSRVRNIAEFRAFLGDNLIFNAAVMDMGWSGEGVSEGKAKSRSGISLGGYGGTNVVELDYTLTGNDP